MSNAMDAVMMAAVFIVAAAAIYLSLGFVLRRIDARHERRSSEIRRKNSG
ncbi:MAG: hypothetical protein HYX29_08805 [Solirubrobacterales bacterium]|nr:hypothetical protein [Solirubrobacterales bacterium]